jgi:hypothetical protein
MSAMGKVVLVRLGTEKLSAERIVVEAPARERIGKFAVRRRLEIRLDWLSARCADGKGLESTGLYWTRLSELLIVAT